MLLVYNVLKKLSSLAIPIECKHNFKVVLNDKKADLIPLPYLIEFYDVWMVLYISYITTRDSYQDSEQLNLILESHVIFNSFLLDSFDCILIA